jgi:hypothetical protein
MLSYGVVKNELPFRFTKTYEDIGEARLEAERLCRKERCSFYVVQFIQQVLPADNPIKWESYI